MSQTLRGPTPSIAVPTSRGILRWILVATVIVSVFTMPVAAQEGSSQSVDICSSSKFPGIVNAIIQLAIYGGVVMGAVMYLGAEAMESRTFLSQEQMQSVQRAKKKGIGKVVKLSIVPALLALLLKSAPLAWAECIELTPF